MGLGWNRGQCHNPQHWSRWASDTNSEHVAGWCGLSIPQGLSRAQTDQQRHGYRDVVLCGGQSVVVRQRDLEPLSAFLASGNEPTAFCVGGGQVTSTDGDSSLHCLKSGGRCGIGAACVNPSSGCVLGVGQCYKGSHWPRWASAVGQIVQSVEGLALSLLAVVCPAVVLKGPQLGHASGGTAKSVNGPIMVLHQRIRSGLPHNTAHGGARLGAGDSIVAMLS